MRSGKHTDSAAYRHLYKTKTWAALRQRIFARDGYQCRKCGSLCTGKGNSPRAPVCDHKQDHKGDRAAFFDAGNLQTLCKSCHDGAKRFEDINGYSSAIGEDGFPLDPRHPSNRPRQS